MINRLYTEKLQKLLKLFPVVAVIGARQTGKTTLCKNLLKEKRRYYTLDDIMILNLSKSNPEAILDSEERITIDEVQKAPYLLTEIKKRVDKNRVPGKYLLTGSANIELIPKLQETLAGRIAFIEMYPVSLFERYSRNEKPGLIRLIEGDSLIEICSGFYKKLNLIEEIILGSYPEPMLKHDSFFSENWFDGYIRSYLERDIRDISNIHSLSDYQRVLSLSSFRVGGLLSYSELAKDCGINLMTVKRYLNLLFISYQYYLLQPFFRNVGKRFVKSPKLYSYDSGLTAYLQGIKNILDMDRLNRSGQLIENKFISEIKMLLSNFLPQTKLFFYNTHGCGEIDLIIDTSEKLIPVEIKINVNDKINTTTIENFMQTFSKETDFALVLTQADHLIEIKRKIFVVPYQYLLM